MSKVTYQFFLILALVLTGVIGCTKNSTDDYWGAAKIAYKAKNQADAIKAFQQISAETYAMYLVADCRHDAAKCDDALNVLELVYTVTEGKDSFNAQLACLGKKTSQVDQLNDILGKIRYKLDNNEYPADDIAQIRERIIKIEKIQDTYLKQCVYNK